MTVYFLSANSKGFEECLDIFAHFFIDPLLEEDMVKSEMSAV